MGLNFHVKAEILLSKPRCKSELTLHLGESEEVLPLSAWGQDVGGRGGRRGEGRAE